VAVTLIEDYVLTIVVSALSGGDQLLSILNLYGKYWWLHFAIGAVLAAVTWYLTIRGRGESAKIVFTLLGIFIGLTITMAIGLFIAKGRGIPAVPYHQEVIKVTLGQALLHLLTASMKGMVALTGLEAMSNGIQFVKNEDAALVKWGKQRLPRLQKLWAFYSGKSGIGRFVQTSFLFYGGLTTLFLSFFAIRFNVFDGTLGRTLVGNLAYIGFEQIPGGIILFWVYQILAVALLAAASMTALQDAQATEWRDVAIGEIPEIINRDKGTFTRSVTITFGVAVLIMLLVRGRTTVAAPFYGVGVFLPITIMGLAIRQHVLQNYKGTLRTLGAAGAGLAAGIAATVFIGQLVGKWEEGGWVRLITFTTCSPVLISSCSLRSVTARRSRSTALCAKKPACRAPWLRLSSGSRSRCKSTATACWRPSLASGRFSVSIARSVTISRWWQGITTTPCTSITRRPRRFYCPIWMYSQGRIRLPPPKFPVWIEPPTCRARGPRPVAGL
jgi:hypothetical protein